MGIEPPGTRACRRPPRLAAAFAAGVLALATGCVTEVVRPADQPAEPLEIRPLVVPFHGADPRRDAADRYYESVVEQMRQALEDRDLPRLRRLLETHDRADAPAWAGARMPRFSDAAAGLAVEELLARHARVGPRRTPEALDVPLELELRVPPVAEREMVVGGGERPLAFLARVTVRDLDVWGTSSEARSSRTLQLRGETDLASAGLALPFDVEPPPGPAVQREVEVRIELLPGTVQVEGRAAPVHRVPVATWRTTLYPRGIEPIRARPLRTLESALRSGDRQHLPHVLLAAMFMPASDRGAAAEQLVRTVRLGREDQAAVAMAALEQLTGAGVPVGDRAGWLQWWQTRTSGERGR